MASKMTSLSAGKILWKLLTEDAAISGMGNKVFPVVTDTAQLPYML